MEATVELTHLHSRIILSVQPVNTNNVHGKSSVDFSILK
jgi:hypothetical protein